MRDTSTRENREALMESTISFLELLNTDHLELVNRFAASLARKQG